MFPFIYSPHIYMVSVHILTSMSTVFTDFTLKYIIVDTHTHIYNFDTMHNVLTVYRSEPLPPQTTVELPKTGCATKERRLTALPHCSAALSSE